MSVLNLDIWGEDIDDSPLVFESGDALASCTRRAWLSCRCRGLMRPSSPAPIWECSTEDGRPYGGDRVMPARAVVDRYKSRGADTGPAQSELEFFLIGRFGAASLRWPLSAAVGQKRRKAAETAVDPRARPVR